MKITLSLRHNVYDVTMRFSARDANGGSADEMTHNRETDVHMSPWG